MEINRKSLPLRKNCEGYFIDKKRNILASLSPDGIIIFPGGGIDDGESISAGMLRETLEETGAIVFDLKHVGTLNIIWESSWAKTEKQRERYKRFRGDEMHFFTGKIKNFVDKDSGEEDSWKGEKCLPIEKVMELIQKNVQTALGMNEYREAQLKFLKELKDGKA